MRYFGGKSRIAKDIANVIESFRGENQVYIEPFVGSGWVISRISGIRYGYDKHRYLIEMFKQLQKGWIPPTKLTRDEYDYIKNNKDENPHLTGFVGFGCSFAGKWFGGYASGGNRNYCLNAHNSILNKMVTMMDVNFECLDYRDLNPENSIIYCDPPYKGTTQYGKIVGEFNSDEFWEVVRNWSRNNTVIVSEYSAPSDFQEIWRKETKTDIRNKNNIREDRVEKLFMYKNNIN